MLDVLLQHFQNLKKKHKQIKQYINDGVVVNFLCVERWHITLQ